MEEWQQDTIIRSLPELIRVTEIDAAVKSKLRDHNILTSLDVEELVI